MQLPSRGLTAWFPRDKLIANTESRHQSVNSAATVNGPLVIDYV